MSRFRSIVSLLIACFALAAPGIAAAEDHVLFVTISGGYNGDGVNAFNMLVAAGADADHVVLNSNGMVESVIDAEAAAGMGLEVGDHITFNVLGREIRARIANTRHIDWRSLGMNFVVIFAPGTLERAPYSHIASVRAGPGAGAEAALERAVTERFPNVATIRVKDALEAVNRVLANIAWAMRITAGITILAGMLVLAGAIAAGHHRRVRDAVMLKVLGARRRQVLVAFMLEYGLLGLATGAIAAAIGSAAAWIVVTQVMESDWAFAPAAVLVPSLIATAVTLLFGFAGTWRALGQKPAPLLRNE